MLADYVEVIDLVSPVFTPRVVPNDADDDQVIAAAVAAHADPYHFGRLGLAVDG